MSGQFYNHASGYTDPADLVSVSPATNKGGVIMHERRLELSMARLSGPGRTPSACHKQLTCFISPRLLFTYIKAAIFITCVFFSFFLCHPATLPHFPRNVDNIQPRLARNAFCVMYGIILHPLQTASVAAGFPGPRRGERRPTFHRSSCILSCSLI